MGIKPGGGVTDYIIEMLNASRKAGFESSKILVIGTPGSGKTYALKTLVKTPETSTNTVKKTKKSEGVIA